METQDTALLQLATASMALFRKLAKDAMNWNGQPMYDGTENENGCLTHLKKRGFLRTYRDEGITWVMFTNAGIEYAGALGENLSWIPMHMRALP